MDPVNRYKRVRIIMIIFIIIIISTICGLTACCQVKKKKNSPVKQIHRHVILSRPTVICVVNETYSFDLTRTLVREIHNDEVVQTLGSS